MNSPKFLFHSERYLFCVRSHVTSLSIVCLSFSSLFCPQPDRGRGSRSMSELPLRPSARPTADMQPAQHAELRAFTHTPPSRAVSDQPSSPAQETVHVLCPSRPQSCSAGSFSRSHPFPRSCSHTRAHIYTSSLFHFS